MTTVSCHLRESTINFFGNNGIADRLNELPQTTAITTGSYDREYFPHGLTQTSEGTPKQSRGTPSYYVRAQSSSSPLLISAGAPDE
jgi:hypothetical protein